MSWKTIKEYEQKTALAEAVVEEWFNLSNPYLPTDLEFKSIFHDKEGYSCYGRTAYTRYSWSVLTKENIHVLLRTINNQPVLEVCCGVGWLAYWLQQKGVNIIATDSKTWSQKHDYNNSPVKIEKLTSAAAVKKYPNINTIICCWPPYKSKWPVNLLKKWLKPGRTLIYIGEEYGCNTVDNFFENWGEPKVIRGWTKFFGMHDNLYVIEV